MPLTIDIFDIKVGHNVSYPIELAARMAGSSRGYPKRNRVVWTLDECSQDGVPRPVPSIAALIRYRSGMQFTAMIVLAADLGFSLNPRRWSVVAGKDDPVVFDENYPIGPAMDPNFDDLDLSSFTTGLST